MPPRYARPQLAIAIGCASSGFAFLNGAGAIEVVLAGVSAGLGQGLRSWLARHYHNHYGVAAVCALVASGAYVVVAMLAARLGFSAHHPAGFISSVLFLVPGFPLVAALFDLLQQQTAAAVSRLGYGLMLLLAVAFGLSIVIAVAGIDIARQPALALPYPATLALRALASFAGGFGFAMLFNSPARAALAVGLVAVAANALRLGLQDSGMMPASATFFGVFGALAVGLIVLLIGRRLDVPRTALTVPAIIIMVPGVAAFEMIVLFNRGQVLEALTASAACGFAIGALAMGLAAARVFDRS
jgi:uncharacterized membrane protein YjjB (DUF3815 family)